MEVSLVGFYYHPDDCEWHLSILNVEKFTYGEELDKSLFSLGKRGSTWFLDVFFYRVFPRI